MKKMNVEEMRKVNGGITLLTAALGIALGIGVGRVICPIVNKKYKAYC